MILLLHKKSSAFAKKLYVKYCILWPILGYQTNINLQEGEHANIATQTKKLFQKIRCTINKDGHKTQISNSCCDLTLNIHLDKEVQFSTSTNSRERFKYNQKFFDC